MPYRLKRRETVRSGLRRVIREQLSRAAQEASDPALDRYRRVHQVRKRLKRVLAALVLVRGEFAACSSLDALLRRPARELAPVRDADALALTLDLLNDRFPGALSAETHLALRGALERRRDALAEKGDLASTLACLPSRLRDARRLLAAWPRIPDRFASVSAGLDRTLRRAARWWREADAHPGEDAYHQTRTYLKYHALHLRLLQGAWPGMLQAHAALAEEAVDLLGEWHDLAALQRVMPDLLADETSALSEQRYAGDALAVLAEQRQEEILRAARPLIGRLLAEPAGGVSRRMGAYWRLWRRKA